MNAPRLIFKEFLVFRTAHREPPGNPAPEAPEPLRLTSSSIAGVRNGLMMRFSAAMVRLKRIVLVSRSQGPQITWVEEGQAGRQEPDECFERSHTTRRKTASGRSLRWTDSFCSFSLLAVATRSSQTHSTRTETELFGFVRHVHTAIGAVHGASLRGLERCSGKSPG